MKPWLSIGVILISVASAPSPASAAPALFGRLAALFCDRFRAARENPVKYFPVNEGIPRPELSSADREVRELGHGFEGSPGGRAGPGGTAYLVRTHSETYVEKNYFRPERALDDAKSLQLLANAIAEDPDGAPFQVVGVRRYDGDRRLELEYVRGRDLHSVLSDPEVSVAVKEHLAETYNRAAKQYLEFLGRHFVRGQVFRVNPGDRIKSAPGLSKPVLTSIREISGGPHLQLSIKPDNFIVDPVTLSLTLIDPL